MFDVDDMIAAEPDTEPVNPPSAPLIVKLPGSPQQEAIWEAALRGNKHIFVQALAGVGKSFCLVQLVMRLPRNLRVLVMSFNVHIVAHLNTLLSTLNLDNVVAKTYNSFGAGVVRRSIPGAVLNKNKVRDLLRNMGVDRLDVMSWTKLVGLLKNTLTSEYDYPKVRQLTEMYGVDVPDELLVGVLPLVMEACRHNLTEMDYDDQIWWPVVHNLKTPEFDMVLSDEGQDVSAAQIELAMLTLGAGGTQGRMVFVADENQAIYGFRGVDTNTVRRTEKRLVESAIGCDILPLTVTRRCPVSHVELAKGIVPSFEALPDAPGGKIECMTRGEVYRRVRAGDAVICRTNAPLIRACYQLIQGADRNEGMRNARIRIEGKDFASGLVGILDRLDTNNVRDMLRRLQTWADKQVGKYAEQDKQSAIEALADRVECLKVLATDSYTVQEIRDRIYRLFGDSAEGEIGGDGGAGPKRSGGPASDEVLLGTGHRWKGLEAKRVFVVKSALIPHPMAKKDWERQQELNLAYVIATRAKFERGDEETGVLVFDSADDGVPSVYEGVYPEPECGKRTRGGGTCGKWRGHAGECWDKGGRRERDERGEEVGV